ncbi:aminomethyl-transferring glycine dehydrogenase subunit GcvPB [Halobacteriovorax sp. ZH4_bin.1]|uniref:aminomethyl-transferring glycine dehydrogenase subunit GcvPB n=1 Tax=unclassified Halobacteriovorax TaxID=2639665 RepID=UPI00372078F6
MSHTQDVSNSTIEKLGFDPRNLKVNSGDLNRELAKNYISASDEEIKQMLNELGLTTLEELFSHIKDDVKFSSKIPLKEGLSYDELVTNLYELSKKNKIPTNFLGDGLPQFKIHEIVPYVCNIRGLTTAYTPYQPERSQGTLNTLWIYSSAITALTGFEAINSSLYDRSTCLFEALKTGVRLARKKTKVLVSEAIYPQDRSVIETNAAHTGLEILWAPINKESGLTDFDKVKELLETNKEIATFAFGQVNSLGLLEDVDALTDLCRDNEVFSIAIIDPILLAKGGLKKPSEYGSDKAGVTMIVGEGQHLCLDANYGGPGLGIFGIRFNDANKNQIRQTAGRYVGNAVDMNNQECLAMVLSTREQHIRREKATSNICSNQSFVASIAGAALLALGDEGLADKLATARQNTQYFLSNILHLDGVELAFDAPYFNEVVLKLDKKASEILASSEELVAGKDISGRHNLEGNLLKVSFGDQHTQVELDKLIALFNESFAANSESEFFMPEIPHTYVREDAPGIATFSTDEVKAFYDKCGSLNVSPDDAIYPLGSCTMKYNPYVNDWAAGLPGFTMAHPDLDDKYTQGTLELLYNIQEDFKAITGLPGLVTQAVAGAQGELVGIKMFQAYHADRGNADTKNVILIPRSAHGTNPATAAVAGFVPVKVDGKQVGIITLDADERGQIDLEQLKEIIKTDGERIAGIMVTNPNTAGIFEENFKEVADLIHSVDGLVYMDGANMNAIAGIVSLEKLGVDACHNNLHKTWTIPHGGGGPGDAIVAVSSKLVDYIPGTQVEKLADGSYKKVRAPKCIGDFHRHDGNVAHKVRAYTYLKALGQDGVVAMSQIAVLSARYLFQKLKDVYPMLPHGADETPRMHEFIITLSDDMFSHIEKSGTLKNQIIAKVGKLFLDFGLHAPTVAFPEVFGLMIEPTESFTKKELDDFTDVLVAIKNVLSDSPEVLQTAPHFTAVSKVDEVWANKNLKFYRDLDKLWDLPSDEISPKKLRHKDTLEVVKMIQDKHKELKQ